MSSAPRVCAKTTKFAINSEHRLFEIIENDRFYEDPAYRKLYLDDVINFCKAKIDDHEKKAVADDSDQMQSILTIRKGSFNLLSEVLSSLKNNSKIKPSDHFEMVLGRDERNLGVLRKVMALAQNKCLYQQGQRSILLSSESMFSIRSLLKEHCQKCVVTPRQLEMKPNQIPLTVDEKADIKLFIQRLGFDEKQCLFSTLEDVPNGERSFTFRRPLATAMAKARINSFKTKFPDYGDGASKIKFKLFPAHPFVEGLHQIVLIAKGSFTLPDQERVREQAKQLKITQELQKKEQIKAEQEAKQKREEQARVELEAQRKREAALAEARAEQEAKQQREDAIKAKVKAEQEDKLREEERVKAQERERDERLRARYEQDLAAERRKEEYLRSQRKKEEEIFRQAEAGRERNFFLQLQKEKRSEVQQCVAPKKEKDKEKKLHISGSETRASLKEKKPPEKDVTQSTYNPKMDDRIRCIREFCRQKEAIGELLKFAPHQISRDARLGQQIKVDALRLCILRLLVLMLKYDTLSKDEQLDVDVDSVELFRNLVEHLGAMSEDRAILETAEEFSENDFFVTARSQSHDLKSFKAKDDGEIREIIRGPRSSISPRDTRSVKQTFTSLRMMSLFNQLAAQSDAKLTTTIAKPLELAIIFLNKIAAIVDQIFPHGLQSFTYEKLTKEFPGHLEALKMLLSSCGEISRHCFTADPHMAETAHDFLNQCILIRDDVGHAIIESYPGNIFDFLKLCSNAKEIVRILQTTPTSVSQLATLRETSSSLFFASPGSVVPPTLIASSSASTAHTGNGTESRTALVPSK